MADESSPQMLRSNSMHLELKQRKRSDEKEVANKASSSDDSSVEASMHTELPGVSKNTAHGSSNVDVKRRISHIPDDISFSNFNENDIPYRWAGSTIELDSDVRRNEFDPVTQRMRLNRVIERNGRENVTFRSIPEKSRRFIQDLVTTLIELDWVYTLTIFIGNYVFTWFLFALLCYTVSYYHGDIFQNATMLEHAIMNEDKKPCIRGVYDFTSILLYSIEIQTTLGFGEKYPNEGCPETIFLFILQIICSIGIEGGLVSIIYAKTARPAKQITKLRFSDKAVICYRDGKLCLLFRVCDIRQRQVIESKIRVFMIVDLPTREGETIKTHTELKLEGNGQQIIVWPEIVCHVIDDKSPLRRFTSAKALNAAQFELYVSIVGVSPATTQVTEARTSYVPREIFWGQRFINIMHYDHATERYVVDFSNFNSTISVDMIKGGKDI